MIWPWTIARLRASAALLRACLAQGAAALLLRIVICITNWKDIAWTHHSLRCCVDVFVVGAAVTVLGPLRARVIQWAPAVFLPSAACVLAICLARHTMDHRGPVIATIGLSLVAVACGALLALALREGIWVSLGVLRTFGKYSHAMYLFDFPLTVFLSPRANTSSLRSIPAPPGRASFLSFACSSICWSRQRAFISFNHRSCT
jgi:peptidoglycan/LPS O-acetylase OafA/YrhL